MGDLVSVILASCNGAKYVETQLKSILTQSHTELEVIAMDDASTDQSLHILQSWAARDQRLKIVQNSTNLGFVTNFFKGMSLTNGQYVCYSDQDDWWHPDKVRMLKHLLDESPENRLAYSDLEICDEGLRPTHTSFWKSAGIQPRQGYLGAKALLRNLAPGCSMMFDRHVKQALLRAEQDSVFLHDHLTFVIGAMLGRIVYSPLALVKYRQHPNNSIGAFYPSVMVKDFFVNDLREKIGYLSTLKLNGADAEIRRISQFVHCLEEGRFFERLPLVDYYLFMRKDELKDKLLGCLECLLPRVYDWLRGNYGTPKSKRAPS